MSASIRILLLLVVVAMPVFADDPKVAADRSVTVAELIEAGAPATDREWTSEDYGRLANALADVAQKDVAQLPRFASEKSGALMARVVSEQNFGLLRTESLPISMRMSEALAFAQHTRALFLLYLQAANSGADFDRELVELAAFTISVNLELWKVSDAMMASLTAEQREARASAIEMMRGGSAQMVGGMITSLGETGAFRTAELTRLASLLTRTLPAMLARLTPESKAEAIVRLRAVAKDATDAELAAALRALLAAVS